MPSSLVDVCRFNPTLGGTTDWTYSSAVTGYQSPTAANAVTNAQYSYRAESSDLAQWEIGTGTWNGTVLTRTAVLFNSSGTTSKISFTLAPQVAIVAIAEDLIQSNTVGLGDRVVNPRGQINQSGVGSQTDVTYDFDQWLTLTQTAAVTVSQQTAVENGTPYMMRSLQAQASAQRFGRIQWLENQACVDLRGKTVAFSARVRMSATTTLRYAIVEWTGTADTITKDIVLDWTSGTFTAGNFFTTTSTTITATGSTALTSNTLATITLAGTVGSSMNNLAVFFWTDSTQAQNVTLDIAVIPSFQVDRATEMGRCQYFWRKSWDYATAVGTAWTGGVDQFKFSHPSASFSTTWAFPQMRVAPTITVYDASGASGVISYYNGIWNNGGAITSTNTRETSAFVQHVVAASTFTNFAFTLNARL